VPRKSAVPVPTQIVCQCDSMVNLVPFADDHTVMIPVDVDRDPAGELVVVGGRAGYTVRPIRDDEEVDARLRRRAHWDTCPHIARWRDAMRTVGMGEAMPSHDPARIGPCARCHQRHSWHYGGPVSSPVCDRCRTKDGMTLMGENS
jgi:hypothetical protein